MNYYAKHAASMQATQGRLAESCPVITWNGKDWTIIPGSARRKKDLNAGGFQLNADLRFEALVSEFLGAATSTITISDAETLKDAMLQTEIGYLGDAYKVDAIQILPGGFQISVECNSLVQGA